MTLNANYCFSVAAHSSHNRLVAGSNPAGATKFKLCDQHDKATVKGGFFVGLKLVAAKGQQTFSRRNKKPV